MQPKIDREWYTPVFHNDHGIVSVTIGLHRICQGNYNVKFSNGSSFGTPVVMVPRQQEIMEKGEWRVVHSDIPFLRIKVNGTTLLAMIPEKDILMARMK